jgi:hypothetical protein
VIVWLPTGLYDRLEAFAAGRHGHRGRPPLAPWVREAVEEYLDRQQQRPRPTPAAEPCAPSRPRVAASLAGAPALPAGDEPWSKRAVVALILGWYEEGMPKPAIVTRLNAAQVPPIVGRGQWNSRKVTRG